MALGEVRGGGGGGGKFLLFYPPPSPPEGFLDEHQLEEEKGTEGMDGDTLPIVLKTPSIFGHPVTETHQRGGGYTTSTQRGRKFFVLLLSRASFLSPFDVSSLRGRRDWSEYVDIHLCEVNVLDVDDSSWHSEIL